MSDICIGGHIPLQAAFFNISEFSFSLFHVLLEKLDAYVVLAVNRIVY